MNLQENIQRIKSMMGLLTETRQDYIVEYIDIPLTKSGETTNNGEPSYDPSRNENRVVNTFSGDFLQLKEFLQNLLPNQNLKYLGAGAMGLGFVPMGNLKFPDSFTQTGFKGQLPPEKTNVVLKVTTNLQEVKKITNIVENFQGQIPGAVTYYFIKEVLLPADKQWSSTIGSPNAKLPGQDKQMRIDDFKKMWNNDWFRKENPGLDDEQIDKLIQRKYENFIELKKKRDEVKFENLYIICLDRLDSLTPEQKDHVFIAFEYFYWLQFHHKKENVTGNRNYKPTSVIKSVYTKEPIMKEWYNKRIEEEKQSKDPTKNFPSFETFVDIFKNLINAIELVWDGPEKPRQFDLHSGNIGLKDNQLVFFDMFA